MANLDETKIICECRYILENAKNENAKNNFNNAPNIHEIDEEESEIEETTNLKQPNPSVSYENNDYIVNQEIKNASDDESAYTGESFCSDESKVINEIASESLKPSSLFCITDFQSLKEPDADVSESRWENEPYSISDETSRATTADKLIRRRQCNRWNMSFTDEEMRKIERENELLLRKIMAQQKPRHRILNECTVQSRISSSAINRKKLQKRIENDNMLLLRRIQQAKSCVFANASKMGCRLTFL